MLGRYFMNLLLAFDNTLNALLGGDRDETISSRLGRIKRHHGGAIPWRRPLAKATDWVLDRIDPGHSLKSIEEGEGTDGLFDRPEDLK